MHPHPYVEESLGPLSGKEAEFVRAAERPRVEKAPNGS
jgi:hypothetical protein